MNKPDKPILRIRSCREAKGYTQEYMAEMLDICQSTYANLESGKTTLSIDRLLLIADILDIDFQLLFECKHKKYPAENSNVKPQNSSTDLIHQETKSVYIQLVDELRNEVVFLRSLIKT